MTPHPHKDILIAVANGLSTEDIEVKHTTWMTWKEATSYITWMDRSLSSEWEVRIKPKTMLFNRQQLPMPMTTAPEEGTVVYIPEPYVKGKALWMGWSNTEQQNTWLKYGLVHSTKEAAIEWANAMIPFNTK